ncbi:glycosyltransferase [Paenibacillus koleovorans]|uniref:glycosyltransferase n=1 Tax=Paenibacillus koleovorans TaxID=121608 RepID=UPI000FD9384C|nr:glycosyltransferase family 2 protein [Paenibacillus koleovorans]
MSIIEAAAAITLLYWTFMLVQMGVGLRLLPPLPKRAEAGSGARGKEKTPLVSVILAAKEEEKTIRETVQHLLQQDYARFEIIAVNDRSSDATGRKLEELRRWSEGRPESRVPLTVIHITTLPDGWLGKNHALYQGYKQAKGKYLLFTDADVRFQPTTIRDAVAYAERQEADHVTMSPYMKSQSFWLRAFVHYFLFSLCLFIRPWRANLDHQHRHGMGIGAFNLISRQTYEGIGTHQTFALRPDDDLQLGYRVKKHGYRQRFVTGNDHLEVEWYPNLQSAVQGLEKNLFSGFRYRFSYALAGMLGQLLFFFFPFIALWIVPGWPRLAYILSAAIAVGLYLLCVRRLTRDSGREAIVFPLTVCLLVYVLGRSVFLTLRRGGIYWRGTFYSLRELKKRKP